MEYSNFTNQTGTYVVPEDTDRDWVVQAMRRGEVYDQFVADRLGSMYEDGDILDIGANFGQMSVYFHRTLVLTRRPTSRVFSFDANPVVFECLVKNLRANCGSGATPIFGAIWNTPGKLVYFPFFNRELEVTYGSYAVSTEATAGYPVSTLSIDCLGFRRRVGIIKVDAQGADLRILEGAVDTIAQHRPAICIEYESKLAPKFGDRYEDYIYFLKFIKYKIVSGESLAQPTDQNWSANLFCRPAEQI